MAGRSRVMPSCQRALRLACVICTLLLVNTAKSQVIVDENFDTDVIGAGDWIASHSSVAVNVANGWLHIVTGDGNSDFAEKIIEYDFPVLVETRMRLVSGGSNYTLPTVHFYYGLADSEVYSVTYLPGSGYGWRFMDEWTGIHTLGPTTVNQWRTIKLVLKTGGGELWAKTDTDTSFTYVLSKTWSILEHQVKVRLVQNWDAVCDFDYIKIQALSDRVYLPHSLSQPCDGGWIEQPVVVENHDLLKGANISFKIPDGAFDIYSSFDGYLTESWVTHNYVIDSSSNVIIVYVSGGDVPPGTNELFGLRFRTERLCRENRTITWDTAFSTDPDLKTFLVGADFENFEPVFDTTQDQTEILSYEPGDVNDDGKVNLADITCLIDQVYISKDTCCLGVTAGRLNSDDRVNLGDITRLIDHVYISKAPLVCWNPGEVPLAKVSRDISLESSYRDGITTLVINTTDELRGVHFELSGPVGTVPVSIAPDKLDLVYGSEGNSITAGLFDMDGAEVIAAGESELIRIPGDFQITYAEAVSMDFEVATLTMNSTVPDGLPQEFALFQNYPNPFNPATTIQFEMPTAASYEMTIYNITGQAVEERSGYAEAGTVSIEWDASDRASGIYFYRLQVGDLVDTKKMILLK